MHRQSWRRRNLVIVLIVAIALLAFLQNTQLTGRAVQTTPPDIDALAPGVYVRQADGSLEKVSDVVADTNDLAALFS